jgi:multiple sugar transport system permease protein
MSAVRNVNPPAGVNTGTVKAPRRASARGFTSPTDSGTGRTAWFRRGRGRSGAGRQQNIAYLFLAPWLLGLLGVMIGPMLYSLYLSFTNYNLLSSPQWVGLQNFTNLMHDPQYIQSVKVTSLFVLVSVPLVLVVSLALALFLNRGLRLLRFYRTLFYLPSLLGTSVAIAVLWLKVFGQPGLLNDALGLLGIHHGSWIGSPATALYTLVALNLWAFGATMIIFLAGVRQVPPEYYEAAQIDGAGWWRRLWHITLPSISPLIFFNLILDTVAAFQTFTSAYVVGNGNGAPAGSLLFYSVYLYIQGFTNLKMGYASAMAWIMFLVLAVFAALCFLSARYWVHYGSDR